jgi:hypothetical protein
LYAIYPMQFVVKYPDAAIAQRAPYGALEKAHPAEAERSPLKGQLPYLIKKVVKKLTFERLEQRGWWS